LESSLSTVKIEAALTAAHIAADEHYNLVHAEKWNTNFEFPQEAIDKKTQHYFNNATKISR
jgi:hypothetical protein